MNLKAIDINGNSVHIKDANRKEKYFCPVCGAPMSARIFGTKRCHHFAHFPGKRCTDSWHYEPMSEWHTSWQNHFETKYQEVYLHNGIEHHRADICTPKFVIEFQHSPISNEDFNKRNAFYTSCRDSVLWIFDMKQSVSVNNDDTFSWKKG